MRRWLISILFICTGWPGVAWALAAELLIKDQGVIWAMAFLDEDHVLFTEREGKFKLANLATRTVKEVRGGPPVWVGGQGGLMDVALHPQYARNKLIYFTYSCDRAQGRTTCLGRAKLDYKTSEPRLENVQLIFAAEPAISSSNHFGSRLAWDSKGQLFMTMGDRYSERDQAQKRDSHLGKILRVGEDGKAEIWSYGHRNPQGIYIHPRTGELWAQEHGPRGGDEINRIKKGANYGWPVITYGREYTGEKIGVGTAKAGMEQPFYHFTPSIAPSSLLIYSGKKYKQWAGDFFSGALALQHVNRLEIKNGKVIKEHRLFGDLHERVRSIEESPAGELYFSTDSGNIYRFRP